MSLEVYLHIILEKLLSYITDDKRLVYLSGIIEKQNFIGLSFQELFYTTCVFSIQNCLPLVPVCQQFLLKIDHARFEIR